VTATTEPDRIADAAACRVETGDPGSDCCLGDSHHVLCETVSCPGSLDDEGVPQPVAPQPKEMP